MSRKNLEFGVLGETAAVDFLKARGYRILKRNYKTKFSEIDIVATDAGVICFVEVKARHSDIFGHPAEAISRRKQLQISRSAICYLKENNAIGHPSRFDILTLLYTKELPEINLIRDAFSLSSNFTV
ncbi:MAG: YraN family protein [Candidatus Omnitrophica bacterium]|nr:YraN family protein [Candidatus Omnitrophota bacterium]MDO9572556.1 YraN family protein [Candidatus Omnitrophota bacterium]